MPKTKEYFKPLGHFGGVVIDMLEDKVLTYLNGPYDNTEYLLNSYEYPEEVAKLGDHYSDKEYMKRLYEKYDCFRPVKNTLKWVCSLPNIDHYEVVVSLDKNMNKIVLQKETKKPECFLKNPYINVHYYWKVTAVTKDGKKVASPIYDFISGDTIRTLDIDGASNNRDLGGWVGPFGKIKQDVLFRGSKLNNLSEEGIKTINNELHLKTEIDLRSPGEAEYTPLGIDNYIALDFIQAMYQHLFYEEAKPIVKQLFDILSNKDNYPLYFHCSIGRDRAGTVAFVVNNLLGASRKHVWNDYLMSIFSVLGFFEKKYKMLHTNEIIAMYELLDRYDGNNDSEKMVTFLKTCGVTQKQIDDFKRIMIE